MNIDQFLRDLLYRKCSIGPLRFDFLEGLLAVCITGIGFFIRTPFETGLPHWTHLLAEWYLALASAVFVWRLTSGRRRALVTYGMLLILPTLVAEGTILQGDACVAALFFVSALLFFLPESGKMGTWLFTLVTGGLLLWSVPYAGILFACMVLWQREKLTIGQLLFLALTTGMRLVYAYALWLRAGYTLVTFHWPNIYEIVGRASIQGQLVDPVALTGLFLTPGLLLLLVWLFAQGEKDTGCLSKKEEGIRVLRLFLFFGLLTCYFLPYMNQSAGCLYGVLAVLYLVLVPKEFLVAMLLQIVIFAGYQEYFRESSMMPMAFFAGIQFLVICWLGVKVLEDAGVMMPCRRKS